MSDVATLGLAVDSSQVKGATTALNQFAAAATPATAAANAHASAHAGMSTQAMAAQHSIRSMVEGMAQGIPVTQMLGMQLNHLAYASSGPGGIVGSFKQAAGALMGLLNPTTLVIAGLAAVGVGTYLAIHAMAETGKQFDDTSRQAGITTDQLHALASAASFKGIDNADFLKAMDKFSVSVYDAKNNMGGLAEVMRANGQSAQTFNQYLQKAADLIKNAKSDQERLQLLQQMGLPATMQWVRFLSQGADGIKKATDEAAKFAASAEGQLVEAARKTDEEWAKTWTNWTTSGKSAILAIASALAALKNQKAVPASAGELEGVYDTGFKLPEGPTPNASPNSRVASGFDASKDVPSNTRLADAMRDRANQQSGGSTVDKDAVKKRISDQQTYIGLLGQTASAAQAAEQVQLNADATYQATGVRVSQDKIDKLKALAVEQALGITQIKTQTDAENVAAATVGMAAGEAAKYTAVQNALNQAKREGKTLTSLDVAAITQQAAALGQAAANADNMRFAYTNLVQGPMETFTADIAQGKSKMDALRDAGMSALNAIAKKLADIAAQNLWAAAFPGGGGSFISSMFSSGSSATVGTDGLSAIHHTGYGPGDSFPTRAVPMSTFIGAPRFHSGIGAGEKAAIIRNDESVLTPGQMKQLAPIGAGADVAGVHVSIDMDANGKWQAHVTKAANVAAAGSVQSFAQSPQFVDHVATASNVARSQMKI